MWVSKRRVVGALNSFLTLGWFVGFTHNLSHSLKTLNSPLTWGYGLFPQVKGLVTTTTYKYIKKPVRFPFIKFLTIKNNLQSFTTAGRLTK